MAQHASRHLSQRFALNHIAAPRRPFRELVQLARTLGMGAVEIRNDLPGVPLQDGLPAATLREDAEGAGIVILSINALQRFDDWSDARAAEAAALAAYAQGCGAAALVLCPTNDVHDRRGAARRRSDLGTALRELAPILAAYSVRGLVEPLGFAECALRRKRDAVDAIEVVGGEKTFSILHDTFHHYVAMEQASFPELTGLVHVSGVEDRSLAPGDMRDAHRVLVGERDVLGNVEQLRRLRDGGYAGPLSFEPFAGSVHAMADVAPALRASMALLSAEITAAGPEHATEAQAV